ncbi:MAG: lipopolysaccharide biosynthesis protein [Eubacteriales bacterium]
MEVINRLRNSKFGKSVVMIAGGTASAQLLNTIFSPVITRIYTPEEYGILTAYVTIIGLSALGAFKYEIGILIAEDEKNAINVFVLSLIVLFGYVTTITVVMILMRDSFMNLFNTENIDRYKYFIPVGILLLGLYQIIRQWAYRKRDFKTIAKTTITQSFLGNIIKVILGLIGFGAPGLIVGNIVKESAGIYTLSKPLRTLEKKYFNTINMNSIKKAAIRYKDFPLFNLPSHFLSNLATKLPIVFLGFLYGAEIVGLFGLANIIVRLPMRLIGASVGDVFYSEAAHIGKKNPKRLKELSNNLMKKLIVLGIIPLSILFFFGSKLFNFAFGDTWNDAGIYASIMSVMVFFMLIFAPISRVYEVYEKQRVKFTIDVIKTILVLMVFGISWYFNFSSYISIIFYSIVMSSIYFIIYIYAQRIINHEVIKKLNE